ncbi:uncharacterized protein [Physeter macrocephalus]|uniref:Uncharacterized protein n=1 Tax=Physeter macrocephalus TaxID=9755 RepID=A0A9W2WGN0_PHYMC|nr:uncharacterized protein LOC129391819 [Physeter catodon]
MERSRRAQEQLLWDLELLTGVGLGLSWPPWAQFCGLRDQAQCVWSQCSKPRGRTDGGSERLTSGNSSLCPSPQAEDSLSQDRQLLEGGLAKDPSSALDLSEARFDADPRWESPGMPAEGPTSGMLTAGICSQENRSPWAGVASLGWEEQGSPHPKSQDSSPSHLFFASYLYVGCQGHPGTASRFSFICQFHLIGASCLRHCVQEDSEAKLGLRGESAGNDCLSSLSSSEEGMEWQLQAA